MGIRRNIIIAIISGILLFSILFISIFNNNSIEKKDPIIPAVNIVYITDDNYVTYMRTSIRSIIANKDPRRLVNIYVLGLNINEKNIEKIKKEQKKHTNIHIIPIDASLIKDFTSRANLAITVSRADNIKFFLASILKDLEKAIYLDCDTIVLKDLSNLYFTELNDNYVGATDDWQSSWPWPSHERYFNNGVMLLNLKKMREDDIESKLINFKKTDKINRFMTQDAFNYVMKGKVLYIPLTYDTFSGEYDSVYLVLSKINIISKCHFNFYLYPTNGKEYQKNVAIIHYCGYFNRKPWQDINFDRKSNRIWYKYAPIDFWEQCLQGKCRPEYYDKKLELFEEELRKK